MLIEIIGNNDCLSLRKFKISDRVIVLRLVMRPHSSMAAHCINTMSYCEVSKVKTSPFDYFLLTNPDGNPIFGSTYYSKSSFIKISCDWFTNIGNFVPIRV